MTRIATRRNSETVAPPKPFHEAVEQRTVVIGDREADGVGTRRTSLHIQRICNATETRGVEGRHAVEAVGYSDIRAMVLEGTDVVDARCCR